MGNVIFHVLILLLVAAAAVVFGAPPWAAYLGGAIVAELAMARVTRDD